MASNLKTARRPASMPAFRVLLARWCCSPRRKRMFRAIPARRFSMMRRRGDLRSWEEPVGLDRFSEIIRSSLQRRQAFSLPVAFDESIPALRRCGAGGHEAHQGLPPGYAADRARGRQRPRMIRPASGKVYNVCPWPAVVPGCAGSDNHQPCCPVPLRCLRPAPAGKACSRPSCSSPAYSKTPRRRMTFPSGHARRCSRRHDRLASALWVAQAGDA